MYTPVGCMATCGYLVTQGTVGEEPEHVSFDLAMHPTKCVLDGSFLVNHTHCVTACHHATVGGETNVETVI